MEWGKRISAKLGLVRNRCEGSITCPNAGEGHLWVQVSQLGAVGHSVQQALHARGGVEGSVCGLHTPHVAALKGIACRTALRLRHDPGRRGGNGAEVGSTVDDHREVQARRLGGH